MHGIRRHVSQRIQKSFGIRDTSGKKQLVKLQLPSIADALNVLELGSRRKQCLLEAAVCLLCAPCNDALAGTEPTRDR